MGSGIIVGHHGFDQLHTSFDDLLFNEPPAEASTLTLVEGVKSLQNV